MYLCSEKIDYNWSVRSLDILGSFNNSTIGALARQEPLMRVSNIESFQPPYQCDDLYPNPPLISASWPHTRNWRDHSVMK